MKARKKRLDPLPLPDFPVGDDPLEGCAVFLTLIMFALVVLLGLSYAFGVALR